MTVSVTHINITPGQYGKLHDESQECWCGPSVMRFKYRNEPGTVVVVDHGVADGLRRERKAG